MDLIESMDDLIDVSKCEMVLAVNAKEPLISIPGKLYGADNVSKFALENIDELVEHRQTVYGLLRNLYWTLEQYQKYSKDELSNLFEDVDEADRLRKLNLASSKYVGAISSVDDAYNSYRNALFEEAELESTWLAENLSLDLPLQIFHKGLRKVYTLQADSVVTRNCQVNLGGPEDKPSAIYEMKNIPGVLTEMDFDTCACLAYGLEKIDYALKVHGSNGYPLLFTGQVN